MTPTFPIRERSWRQFFDDAVPYQVKKKYLPGRLWQDAPFGGKDAHFFNDGVLELSELFTTGRGGGSKRYFSSPRFRSSYLLYFLPFQAAKFVQLFQIHDGAIQAALKGAGTGPLTVADIGSGPGTASFALLQWLMDRHGWPSRGPIVKLEWIDQDPAILEDGAELLEEFKQVYKIPAGRLELKTHRVLAKDSPSVLPEKLGLVLAGNVLNEIAGSAKRPSLGWIQTLLDRARGGGFLMVEPADRDSSQLLSHVRDTVLGLNVEEPGPMNMGAVWGPCLHGGACPLREGKDWCHFSAPGGVPGRWFKYFSRDIGPERQWLKFSYLWLAAPKNPRPPRRITIRRVISGPLAGKGRDARKSVLICQPGEPGRQLLGPKGELHRGDLIEAEGTRLISPFGVPEL